MSEPVLSVRNLRVEFATRRDVLHAIDGVSFDIAKGEVLGVVGESGAGKSVTGLAVIGLIDPRKTGDGFSRTGFANHAQHLTLGDIEGNSVDRAQHVMAGDELDPEIAH